MPYSSENITNIQFPFSLVKFSNSIMYSNFRILEFLSSQKRKFHCFGPSFMSETFETVSRLFKMISKAEVFRGP